jgi:hypothetical protein
MDRSLRRLERTAEADPSDVDAARALDQALRRAGRRDLVGARLRAKYRCSGLGLYQPTLREGRRCYDCDRRVLDSLDPVEAAGLLDVGVCVAVEARLVPDVLSALAARPGVHSATEPRAPCLSAIEETVLDGWFLYKASWGSLKAPWIVEVAERERIAPYAPPAPPRTPTAEELQLREALGDLLDFDPPARPPAAFLAGLRLPPRPRGRPPLRPAADYVDLYARGERVDPDALARDGFALARSVWSMADYAALIATDPAHGQDTAEEPIVRFDSRAVVAAMVLLVAAHRQLVSDQGPRGAARIADDGLAPSQA